MYSSWFINTTFSQITDHTQIRLYSNNILREGGLENCRCCLNSRPGLLIELILCARAILSTVLHVKVHLVLLADKSSITAAACQQGEIDNRNVPGMEAERCVKGSSLRCTSGDVPLVMAENLSDAPGKHLKEWDDELYEQQDTISRHTLLLQICSSLWCPVVIVTADSKHTILSHEVYRYAKWLCRRKCVL